MSLLKHTLYIPLTLSIAISIAMLSWGSHAQSTNTIHISADRLQLFDKGKRSVYTGNAYMRRNTLTIRADKIEVLRDNVDIKKIKAWGTPATLINTDPIEPFSSSASYFMLNNETRWLTLENSAVINQNQNRLQGERIRINLNTKEADIQGGEQRAKLVIQPDEKTDDTTKR